MDITVSELKSKLEQKEDFILIDVRETYEHNEFNVGGQLIPLGTLPTQLEALAPNKDKEVVVYCRSGNRSGVAKSLMQQAGFTNVRNLLGGMLDWVNNYGAEKP